VNPYDIPIAPIELASTRCGIRRYILIGLVAALLTPILGFPGVVLLNNDWHFIPFIRDAYTQFTIPIFDYTLPDEVSLPLSISLGILSFMITTFCLFKVRRTVELNHRKLRSDEQSDPPKSPVSRDFESYFFCGDWVIAIVTRLKHI
jgi:hypothetical protein